MILSNVLPVIVNGGYTLWTAWSACSQTCGDGFYTKTRRCENPTPQFNGKTCLQQNLGPAAQFEACRDYNCPSKIRSPPYE